MYALNSVSLRGACLSDSSLGVGGSDVNESQILPSKSSQLETGQGTRLDVILKKEENEVSS